MVHRRLLEDYESRLRDARAMVDEADAEISAGTGVEYADAQALTDEVVKRGTERLARKD